MARVTIDQFLVGAVAAVAVLMSLACGFADDDESEPRTLADDCRNRCERLAEPPQAHEDAETPHPCTDESVPNDCEARCLAALEPVEAEGRFSESSCKGCMLNSMGWWGNHTESRSALDLFETSCVEFTYFGTRAERDTDIVGDCVVQSTCEEFHYPAPAEPNSYCGPSCGY